jgi:type I restriction-modification system DNA methylase subunit
MNYSKDTFRQIFQQPFNQNQWQEVLRDFFHATVLRAEPEHIDGSSEDEQGFYFGAIDTDDSYRIGLFHFDIKHGDVSRKRVGLRNLVRSFVNPKWGEFDAALVVFDSHESWRLSFICDIKGEATAPKRYTFVFGDANNWYNTAVGRFMDMKDKGVNFANIKEAFSVEALTKEFYNKLYNWFLWAKDKRSGVTFPNKIDTDTDDRDKMEVKMIRLITRMLFVWFIKQKHLVPNNLFETDFLTTILRDFDPESTDNGNYYNAILQNLFFATLNQEIEGRKLLTTYKNRTPYYSNKQLYRDTEKSYFTYPLEERERHIINLFKDIPYLNGGLFECLDKYELDEAGEKIVQVTNYDGFSHENTKSPNGNFKKKAFIPNALFFAAEHQETVTIKEASEGKPEETQTIPVMGLIELFKQYNFTVEENTTSDVEVSLDPELLGRVFENLLAAYNPETQESARKSTGSYYTPREIVDYMVEESLIAYLSGECGHDEKEMRSLVKGEGAVMVTDADKVIDDLKNIKVLDPACGSGAFPMGVLLKITDIIERLHPDGFSRYQTKLDIIKKCIYGIDIQPIAMLICKLRFFISLICDSEKDPSKPNYGIIPLPNLETKFVAANSLLPAKLRQFDNDVFVDAHLRQLQDDLLALRQGIFDLRTHAAKLNNKRRDREKCREIKAYIRQNATQPNKQKLELFEKQIADCEAKLPLYDGECWIEEMTTTQTSLFEEPQPTLFRKDVNKEKREKLQAQIRSAKAEIEKEQSKKALPGFEEAVDEVTEWDPYNQNAVAPFFDAEWMFGIVTDKSSGEDNRPSNQGFDIVIGNPPYISAPTQIASKTLAEQRELIVKSKKYKSLYQKWDLYIPFIELGIQLNCKEGVTSMIVPFPLTNQLYARELRRMLVNDYNLFELVDLNGTKVFENATVSNCIPFIKKAATTGTMLISHINERRVISHSFEQSHSDLVQDTTTLVWNVTQEKRETNRHANMNVLGDFCYISVGMVLNADEKTAKGEFSKEDLISTTKDAIHCRKYIEAKDIEKYHVNRIRYLEYDTDRSPDKLRRPTFRELYNRPKLVMNCLGTINATLDVDNHYLHNHSIYCGVLWKDFFGVNNKSIASSIKKFCTLTRKEMEKLSQTVDLRYLLGVMNSHYASILLTNLRGGDYHIYPEHIRNIPIPSATPDQQQPIINLVNKILSSKKVNPQANTSIWEKEIDELVYKLYGLSEEEIRIVKGGL